LWTDELVLLLGMHSAPLKCRPRRAQERRMRFRMSDSNSFVGPAQGRARSL
jgi:hypothetical protein